MIQLKKHERILLLLLISVWVLPLIPNKTLMTDVSNANPNLTVPVWISSNIDKSVKSMMKERKNRFKY